MRGRAAALLALLSLQTLLAGAPRAAGLVDDFRSALANDATWQTAVATRDADVEARAQGLAGLLPQVSFSAAKGYATTEASLASGEGPSATRDHYDTYNYALQIRQPLFRLRNWATYEQGKAQEAYAEARLKAARQELALRVVVAYAQWAAARAELEAAEVQVAASEFQLRALERTLRGGDTTRVEVEAARSPLARAEADRTDAQGHLQAAMLEWRQITGREGGRPTLPVIGADAAERLRLETGSLADWQARALASNSQIRALERSVDTAREEARKMRADHYPTIDLYAARSLSQSDTDVSIGRQYDTTRFGIQMNVPIYAGGSVSSSVRRAEANLRRAESELEAGKQSLKLQVERDWHGFQAARAQAEAAAKVVEASKLAAYAARLGTVAGSATRSEEIAARAQQAGGQRDLITAGARALVMWARLMGAIDGLDEETLASADAWTGATAMAVDRLGRQ